MDGKENFGVKINNIQSSLKFFNFDGMDKDKIIEKYEESLCQREKQIRDIAYEIGIINEKLSSETIKKLEDENQNLHNKILKKDTLLEQELTNKDIMFIKLNNLQNENDKLMKILQENGVGITSSNKNNSKNNNNYSNKKSFFSSMIDKLGGNKKKEDTKYSNQNKNIQLNNKVVEDLDLNDNLNQNKETIYKNNDSNNKNLNNSNRVTNSSINSSISATITQDLLNNINLNVDRKSENYQNTNKKSSQNSLMSRSSLTMSRIDKRLASEIADYEPVFK